MSLRVVYMGTPDFSVPALEAILNSHHDVVGVFTQPDRPSGRGKKVAATPVKECALAHNVPVFQPEKLRKNDEVFQQFVDLKPDIAVVAAYGQILPQRFLDVPRLGCINIHASLLPRHRGASPIQASIVDGDEETGVTIMQMEAGLDTGPMFAKSKIPIDPLDTAQTLHDKLSELGARMIVEVLDQLESGTIHATPQDDSKSTYAPLLKKEDGRVDFTRPARAISDQIRGLNPWPGAQTTLVRNNDAEQQVKLLLAKPYPDLKASVPGEIIVKDKRLLVMCGDHAIEILELQPSGSRSMSARDFLNGSKVTDHDRFQ